MDLFAARDGPQQSVIVRRAKSFWDGQKVSLATCGPPLIASSHEIAERIG
jgi:hypothetical protein